MQIATDTILKEQQKTVDILGLPVNPLTMEQLIQLADRHIKSRKQLLLGVINAAKLVNSRRDPQLRQSLDQADIILADGAPIVWLSKVIGKGLPQRVPGIDIMFKLLELASQKSYSVYFLGAKPLVIKKVARFVKNNYTGLRIAGFRDGYFIQDQEKNVAEEIKKSNADILFVAMSSPKKENFLKQWQTFMSVPVCHGVGGSFDIIAGVTKRAPKWMQKCGLEWLYRVIQEPRRMWKRYLVTNTLFITLSIKAIIQTNLNRFFAWCTAGIGGGQKG